MHFSLLKTSKQIKRETIVAFVFFAVTLYIMALFQVWTDHTNPGFNHVLPDVGFMTLPYIENEWITDVYIHLLLIITLIRIIFTPYTQTILRRFLWISGFLYLFRCFTISFTILPTPYSGCDLHEYNNPFYIAFKVIIGQHSTCGDVMYSGHTMMITSAALLWHLYTPYLIPKIIMWIATFAGMLVIISTHFHYSDDVIIAFMLTIIFYNIYHWALWIGEIHHFGGNAPFAFIGDLVLKLDGTYCDRLIDQRDNTCYEQYNSQQNINRVQSVVNTYNPQLNNKKITYTSDGTGIIIEGSEWITPVSQQK